MHKKFNCLGLMSGTSGDGVDASIINSNGTDQFEVLKDKYYEYDSNIFNSLSISFKCFGFNHKSIKIFQLKYLLK